MVHSHTKACTLVFILGLTSLARAEEIPTAAPSAPTPARAPADIQPRPDTSAAAQPRKSEPSAPAAAGPKAPRAEEKWPFLHPCGAPESDDERNLTTDCSGVFGLRGAVLHLGGAQRLDTRSLVVAAQGEEYVRRGFMTSRTLHRFEIGGGSGGFDATLYVNWAVGVRVPVSPSRRHGPVMRVGMVGYIRGNDANYGSLLELPQIQLGYQYQRAKTVVELGATGGAALVGRSRIGEADRRVIGAGFEVGGYAAVQWPWFRLGLSASRLPTNDRLAGAVNVYEGTLCARAHGLGICTDVGMTATSATVTPGTPPVDVRSTYAGLLLGFTRE